MPEAVYLDYQSTTPCDERVVQAMLPYFTESFANAGSVTHSAGRDAAEVVEESRKSIATLIGAESRDLIFTASATEANNLAIKGLANHELNQRKKILVCVTDHASVLRPAEALEAKGFEVCKIKVKPDGGMDLEQLTQHLDTNTLLLSICQGNSEIGSLQDLKTLSGLCRKVGAYFHVDATQAILTEEVNVEDFGIDLLSMSGHKIYGPKGVGVLYRRRKQPRVRLCSELDGGEQEWGLRAGTLNIPGIVGFARACEIVMANRESERKQLKLRRDNLRDALLSELPEAWVNTGENGLVNNLSIGISGLDAQALLCDMPLVQCSKGSSCSLDISKPSHVLLNIGLDAKQADACLRFSVGRFTTETEIEFAIQEIIKAVKLNLNSYRMAEVVS